MIVVSFPNYDFAESEIMFCITNLQSLIYKLNIAYIKLYLIVYNTIDVILIHDSYTHK